MRSLVDSLDRMAVLALLAMMLLTTSDVVLRKLVNRPILGVTELVEMALGVSIFFAAPGVFARGANLAVDMIDQWAPDWSSVLRRIAAMVSLLTLVLLLAWHMWRPMIDVIAFGDTSADLQIPKIWFMAPAWGGVLVSSLVAALVLIAGEAKADGAASP